MSTFASPESFPTSTAETNQIVQALVELTDRLSFVEMALAIIADTVRAPAVKARPDGPGIRAMRERNDQVLRGVWGARGVDRYLEAVAASKRQPVLAPVDPDARLRARVLVEAQRLGARVTDSNITWRPEPGDMTGRKRGAQARANAELALAAEKGLTQ